MMAPAHELDGLRILVIEDEFLVAADLVELVESLGGRAVGPCSDIESARERLQTEALDGAVVDLNLRGKQSASLAAEIAEKGIPMLYYSGYGTPAPGESLPPGRRVAKPSRRTVLEKEMIRTFVSRLRPPKGR